MEKMFDGPIAEAKDQSVLSYDEIINLPPEQLAGYLLELEEQGQLEDFLRAAQEDESLLAHLSYWEKWLKKDQRRMVEEVVARKKQIYGEHGDGLPLDLENKFDEDEIKLIMSRIEAIQLTFGCSKGCPFCGLDAIKGAREHIPYDQLARMFQQYGHLLSYNKPVLYWASEPSDYVDEDRTYADVHQLAREYGGYHPHTTTREAEDENWLDYVKDIGNTRVSVYGMDREQVTALEEKFYWAVGKDAEHLQGIGISAKKEGYFEDEDDKRVGIACKDGLVMTPRGLYSVTTVPISREFPQGQVVVPLEDISEEAPKAGDSLQNVFRHGIARTDFSILDASKKEEADKPGVYTGFFPREMYVQQKEVLYKLIVDEKNRIVSVTEAGNRRAEVVLQKAKDAVPQGRALWEMKLYLSQILGEGAEQKLLQMAEEIDFSAVEPTFFRGTLSWEREVDVADELDLKIKDIVVVFVLEYRVGATGNEVIRGDIKIKRVD